ncbi:MAG: hypothetical protein ACKO0M_12915 [Cyanobium sp.]
MSATLLIPLGAWLALRWSTGPVLPIRSPSTAPAKDGAAAAPRSPIRRPAPPGSAVDPNLPLYRGDTRRIAAQAIDDTAAAPFDEALVALGLRFQGTPWRRPRSGPMDYERLEIDLTTLDDLSYVEQLIALVNSRRVKTRTEAVDRTTDHVRWLRYGNGRVEPCQRLSRPGLWALAAQRRGYLVDLSRFLPGAKQGRVPTLPSPSAASGVTVRRHCRRGPKTPAEVPMAFVPLAEVRGSLPSLRSGDVFVLVETAEKPGHSRIGLVEIRAGKVGSMMAVPGRGVISDPDLLRLARETPATVGIAFLRPIPNEDGRAER